MNSVHKIFNFDRARTRQTKEIKANIDEMKRKPTNEYEHTLLYYATK